MPSSPAHSPDSTMISTTTDSCPMLDCLPPACHGILARCCIMWPGVSRSHLAIHMCAMLAIMGI